MINIDSKTQNFCCVRFISAFRINKINLITISPRVKDICVLKLPYPRVDRPGVLSSVLRLLVPVPNAEGEGELAHSQSYGCEDDSTSRRA